MKPGLSGLYGITDPLLLPTTEALLSAVEAALRGGLRVLQYRAKNIDQATQELQARALQQLCHRYQVPFIINDDVVLAAKVCADGVHLGRDDADIASARIQLGAQAIIGCSCYDRLDRALQAQQQGADYVAFGRFFPSKTKPQASPASPELLTLAQQQLTIPLCAIGGITTRNASLLIEKGANMIAVIEALFGAEDVYKQAKTFSELI